jgi:hypothetical protein
LSDACIVVSSTKIKHRSESVLRRVQLSGLVPIVLKTASCFWKSLTLRRREPLRIDGRENANGNIGPDSKSWYAPYRNAGWRNA